jgi:hypothetical protein
MFRQVAGRDTMCSEPGQERRAAAGGAGAARRPAGGGCEVRVIEHQRGYYEVRDVPYGKVYNWRPERLVFECDCGETHVSSGSAIACACGAVYADVPERERPEESSHPWLEDYEEWRRVREARDLRHEYFVVVEGSDD